jgi:hypothetical protein
MQAFLDRHRQKIIGVLHGYDRLLFRGCLRSISYPNGLGNFLAAHGVRYAQFGVFAQQLSDQLKAHASKIAQESGRPYEYLQAGTRNKEQIALQIAQRDRISQGLICVLRCVEVCKSFGVQREGKEGKFHFARQSRKCLFFYFYYMDRDFGLMHIRLQSWLPFDIQICVNGREWLARQMARAGIGFEQRDNCFVRIDDLPRAQKMMEQLEKRKWAGLLSAMARRVNPLPRKLNLFGYYWSVRESEYATDILFRDQASLASIYPHLVDHALRRFSCHDVMKFLGRRTNACFNGEASTNIRYRAEGMRIKHWIEENSMKMYDKQLSVLRVETTLNNVRRFKVRRCTLRRGKRAMHWIPMRKGIMDLPRRTQVCRAANQRYLQALGVVGEQSPTRQLLDPLSRRITQKGRPYRALRPVSPEEASVFAVVMDGRYHLKGFTNAHLRQALLPHEKDAQQRRRQSGRITRILRLLRAHGLVRKVSHTRSYRVTDRGQIAMTAVLRLRETDVSRLAA